MFETLAALAEPWATYYADHATLSTMIIALHIVAMFVGGGMALGADRAILRSPAGSADGARAVVADLATTHRVVIGALVVTVLSGTLLVTSDVATYSTSVVYWVKMGAFVMLLVNGLAMRSFERRVLQSLDGAPIHTAEMPVPFPKSQWSRVKVTAGVSFTLWITIVILGVFVSNN